MKIQNIVPVFLLTTLILAGCQKSVSVSEETSEPVVIMTNEEVETSEPAPDDMQNSEEIVSYDGEYMLDTEVSTLGWAGKKIIGGAHNGTVDIESGDFMVVEGVGSGTFVLDMTTIKDADGSEGLENHLKNEDFFDVVNHPTATLVLKDVDVVTGGAVEAMGDLTIKGITNPITFTADFSQEGEQTMVATDFSLDRTLWDIRYGSGKFFSDIGDKAIDDMMNFSLALVFEKK